MRTKPGRLQLQNIGACLDRDNFDKRPLQWLVVLFVGIVAIILLNVLITIVGESYTKARENSKGIYYRLKIDHILDVAGMMGILPNKYPFRRIYNSEDIEGSLTKKLEKAKGKASEDETKVELNLKRALRETHSQLGNTQKELKETQDRIVEMESKMDKVIDLLENAQ